MNFISDILTFAYRGSGKSILLICVILSVIASIASFAPIFGIIAWILFTGYFCSIFYQIIRSSAIGGMEAPNFPETSNILEDVIVPMLQVILVVMVSFAPYFVYTLFISSDHPDPMISNIFYSITSYISWRLDLLGRSIDAYYTLCFGDDFRRVDAE